MFRKKSLREHEASLKQRFSRDNNIVSKMRLKKRCDYALEALRRKECRSPEKWALHANTLSSAARFIMRSHNPEEVGQWLGVSAITAIRSMAACVKLCRDKCTEYRRTGVNPQVEVVIQPCIEQAKATWAEWKAWQPRNISELKT